MCLEEIGYERFLSEVEHEVLDRQGDYEFIRINWHAEEEPIYLIKVKCSSTGVFYALRVSPYVKTVQEAIAWTFALSEHEYRPQEES
jgi:hypothetical protein